MDKIVFSDKISNIISITYVILLIKLTPKQMIRPQSITTYPCSIIITLWQLLGVGSALAKLTCNPVDFLLLFQLSWNIFTTCLHATKLKKSYLDHLRWEAPYITYLYYRKKFLATGTGLITKLTTIQACSTTSCSVYCSSISTSLSFGFRQ